VSGDPYETLLALTEREYEAATAGDAEQLAAVDSERRALLAELPAVAPEHARPALVRAADVQARTSALLTGVVAELRREAGRVSHGRTAVRGYGAAPSAPAPSVDLAG
jgi:hypothetical protein